MKTLDLKNFEVTEFSLSESQNISCGFWNFVAGYLAGKLIDVVVDSFIEANSQPAPTITSHVANCGPY